MASSSLEDTDAQSDKLLANRESIAYTCNPRILEGREGRAINARPTWQLRDLRVGAKDTARVKALHSDPRTVQKADASKFSQLASNRTGILKWAAWSQAPPLNWPPPVLLFYTPDFIVIKVATEGCFSSSAEILNQQLQLIWWKAWDASYGAQTRVPVFCPVFSPELLPVLLSPNPRWV